jgi:hypothetical protein
MFQAHATQHMPVAAWCDIVSLVTLQRLHLSTLGSGARHGHGTCGSPIGMAAKSDPAVIEFKSLCQIA